MNHNARVLDLGLRGFAEVWQLQQELVAARQKGEITDTLVLVEHPEVITLGRGTKPANLLPAAAELPRFEIERGGDVTYHGPGQLVGYPIFQLREDERDLHLYLRNLEEALIRVAGDFGVKAGRRPGMTGVWTVDEPARKLVSLGIAIRKWVTMHGFALNVATDLSRFALINPCGMDAAVMASLSSVADRSLTIGDVKGTLVSRFGEVFGRDFTERS